MKSVAECLAEQMRQAGIQTVYGLPGGENVEVLEAMRRQGMDFVLVRNESSACYMAATVARMTGRPSAALTTLGPGAVNAYAGCAHAFLDRAPILLITAASDPNLAHRHTHQVLDLQAIFRPICKFTAELIADDAAHTIRSALHAATSGRPGPVHLSIHSDVASQTVKSSVRPAPPEATSIQRRAANDEQFAAFFADKRRPVIVAGLGLAKERPYAQLRRLAESISAPLIDTPKSKGALSADHPLFVGTIGLTRDDPAYAILDEADCLIAVGFDVVELVRPWQQSQPLLWIANWDNNDPVIPCAIECVGRIGETLDALSRTKLQEDERWGATRVAAFRAKQAAVSPPPAESGRILPQSFLKILRQHCPDDVLLATDVGSHKIFTALHWPARRPNAYFVSNGLSAMGFGLSSAIAAAQVSMRPTVCITGDAGLAMVMGELGLLAELNLPVTVCVMHDAALDLIRSAQIRRAGPIFGTEFRNPDFRSIAQAFALDFRRVESPRDCDEAVRHGMASGKPLLMEVMIDPIGYPTTPR